ncbi:MAG: hypothetical protein ACXADA_17195 [Candidatus Hodarchaeales archaeon]
MVLIRKHAINKVRITSRGQHVGKRPIKTVKSKNQEIEDELIDVRKVHSSIHQNPGFESKENSIIEDDDTTDNMIFRNSNIKEEIKGEGLTNLATFNPDRQKLILESLYWNKGFTQTEIGKMLFPSDNLTDEQKRKKIGYIMNKLGCKTRTKQQAIKIRNVKSIPLPTRLFQIIIGIVLGDGHLAEGKYTAWLEITMREKSKPYLEYIKHICEINSLDSSIRTYTRKNAFKHARTPTVRSCNFRTKGSVELFQIRRRFYPNRKKIVPKNIELAPLVCLHWFLGDGSYKKDDGRIYFSTDSFKMEDIQILANNLYEILDVANLGIKGVTIDRRKHLWLQKSVANRFFEYIREDYNLMKSKSPCNCFDYKFNFI